jgi:alpha-L-fucosidase
VGLQRRHLLIATATATGALTLDLSRPVAALAEGHPVDADAQPIPVPLDELMNNNGIGTVSGDANLDGSGYGFPADSLPSGSVTAGGVPYDFPVTTSAGQNDNVVALGQTIALPAGRYVAGYLLATSTYGATSGTVTVHYSDGTSSTATISVPDWYASGGAVSAPTRYSPGGTDNHPVSIYAVQVWLDPARTATGLTLPTTAAPAPNVSSLHIFALTLQPVIVGSAVGLRDIASTTGWLSLPGGRRAQIVRATVTNLGTEPITRANQLRVSVTAPGVQTVVPARITSLATGEEARIQIGVTSPDLAPGSPVTGSVKVTGRDVSARQSTPLTAGIPPYTRDVASLSQHTAPNWFHDAKFGIFIHWGIYSVPAWAPVGQQYAEWYWQQMNNPNNPTYAYHRQTYGEDFAYDDFIPLFTASRFDPHAWVRLFIEAGARYFVLTSKHHEGFALFNSAVSDRTSVKMGPKRDLVGELFDAAERYAPQLRRGLYYSLPEWYNPANPWQGHGPRNPYTGADLPYTGAKPITDYVAELQVPQLQELITQYRPDILWGDIGTPATDPAVLQLIFNQALESGREVTINNRFGMPFADFTTPEYASTFSLQTMKFEACRGIDPFSFGYNAQTPDDRYATAEELIRQLVDIVSKNGNLLLDIGPRADGTIPEIMQTRLRDMGAWLRVNGEAIYGTTYWARGAAEGDLRFTIAPNKAFYVCSLTAPGSQLTVRSPVPIRQGDRIRMLGYHGGPLHWSHDSTGALVIDVPPAAVDAGRYVWVFRIG